MVPSSPDPGGVLFRLMHGREGLCLSPEIGGQRTMAPRKLCFRGGFVYGCQGPEQKKAGADLSVDQPSMGEIRLEIASSTSSRALTVSREVKVVRLFSMARRRISTPAFTWAAEWGSRVLMR